MHLSATTRQMFEALARGDLAHAWELFRSGDISSFLEAVEVLTGEAPVACDDCGTPIWSDDSFAAEGHEICEGCIDNYNRCSSCEELYSETETVGHNEYCYSCRDSYCHWCEHCEEYYEDGNEDEHGVHHPNTGGSRIRSNNCECEAPLRRFRFPANGEGTVAQDERIFVQLPSGVIDERGLKDIAQLVYSTLGGHTDQAAYDAYLLTQHFDPTWQTKRGNFTKRLARALHERFGERGHLPPHVVSEIGNMARQHASSGSGWYVEFTRDLNQSSEAFYNEDSCWWGGYSSSRCALKNWGGLAIRSYGSTATRSDCPDGRAWVQPLNEDLKPTHDTVGAFAYVIYNGYGNLSGYVTARIVAHLTGKTYRKVEITLEPQYVNGNTGYLVASPETIEQTDSIHYHSDEHNDMDAHDFIRSAA